MGGKPLNLATVPPPQDKGGEQNVGMETTLSKNNVPVILDYLQNNSFQKEYLLYKTSQKIPWIIFGESVSEKTHGFNIFFDVLSTKTKFQPSPLCWGEDRNLGNTYLWGKT